MAKTNQPGTSNCSEDHILHFWEYDGCIYLAFPFCIVMIPMEKWTVIKKDLKPLISGNVFKKEKDVSSGEAGQKGE